MKFITASLLLLHSCAFAAPITNTATTVQSIARTQDANTHDAPFLNTKVEGNEESFAQETSEHDSANKQKKAMDYRRSEIWRREEAEGQDSSVYIPGVSQLLHSIPIVGPLVAGIVNGATDLANVFSGGLAGDAIHAVTNGIASEVNSERGRPYY